MRLAQQFVSKQTEHIVKQIAQRLEPETYGSVAIARKYEIKIAYWLKDPNHTAAGLTVRIENTSFSVSSHSPGFLRIHEDSTVDELSANRGLPIETIFVQRFLSRAVLQLR